MKKYLVISTTESGNALMVALIMLFVGSIMIVPVVAMINTGTDATAVQELKMREFYAADAGIQDATNKIRMNYSSTITGFSLPQTTSDPATTYTLNDINGKNVNVTIERRWLFEGISGLETEPTQVTDLVIQGETFSSSFTGRTYRALLGCKDGNSLTKTVNEISVWLPSGFEYVAGSTVGVTTTSPTQTSHHGGTILTWDIPNTAFEDLPVPAGWPTGGIPLYTALAFNYTPASEVLGSFPWMLADDDDTLYWDESCATYKITSTATDGSAEATAYVNRGLLTNRDADIYGDYRAIGSSMMVDTDSDGIRDHLFNNSNPSNAATLNDMPVGNNNLLAYLYWSAWINPAGTPSATDIDEAQITFPGHNTTVTAEKVQILPNFDGSGNPNGWSYSCRADVTDIMKGKGNGNYKVKELEGIESPRDVGNAWSYAGWSLVVVYAHPAESAHACYYYDKFFYMDEYGGGTSGSPIDFTMPNIEGFVTPHLDSGDEGARITIFVGEGDEGDAGWGDDGITFGGSALPIAGDQYNPGGMNPQNNVWNGKSSAIGGETIHGVDIDTFDATSLLVEGQTSATITLHTDLDSWNLVYVLLSFAHDPDASSSVYPTGFITYLQ